MGLTGPWISGGIEFNWPQHHRPTTYLPVDWKMEKQADGSASVLVSDVDQMYGTKGMARFTLYPPGADLSGEFRRGRLEGTRDNHLWYHLGLAEKEQGHEEEARCCFEKATEAAGRSEAPCSTTTSRQTRSSTRDWPAGTGR